MARLRIALVTTARSDYSTMGPLMRAAAADPAVESLVFCAGMHWLPRFGDTWKRVAADVPIDEEIRFFDGSDDPLSLPRALGAATTAFAEALARRRPDWILVSGDRVENLALMAAATALRIPVAHHCGGDLTEGAFDNQVRHAMTKLSHLHFAMMEEHARRLRQMGEEPWRVSVTGDAALDVLDGFVPRPRAELPGIPGTGPFVLSTFHPQTLGREDAGAIYANLLDVLAAREELPVLTYPNVDPGFAPLVERLEAFRRRRPDAVIAQFATQEAYYSAMAHARYMIGNSSSGIWEAPSFGLPAVNVGSRQAGRTRAGNVIDVPGTDRAGIEAAAAKAASTAFRESLRGLKNPYGAGGASRRILAGIKGAPVDDRLMMKTFHEIREA